MNYLDHAATTPVLPEVAEAMLRVYKSEFGNPSSVHAFGRQARELVEQARDQIADAIGASPAEIVFTGGGTEADNLALKGATAKLRGNGNHIVTSTFEHHAVSDTIEWLEKRDFDVTWVPVTSEGIVEPDAIGGACTTRTILVSVMAVNNEIGTVQDLAGIASAVKAAAPNAVVHSDAVQALGNVPVDVSAWGVDLAAFSAHKLGGPKGVGALYVRSRIPLEAVIHGGGHERGLRSGTLNVAGIVGFGVAVEIAAKEVHEKAERVAKMRDRLLEGVRTIVPDVVVNGDLRRRVPGNLHISVPGARGETLLLLLDAAGIAVSTGSACQSGAVDPSHVLLAIGLEPELADGSIRFSLGRASTDADVDAVLDVLPRVIERTRKAG